MTVLFYSRTHSLRGDEPARVVALENAGYRVDVRNARYFGAQGHQFAPADLVVTDDAAVRAAYEARGVPVEPVTTDAMQQAAVVAEAAQALAAAEAVITHEVTRNGRWTIYRGGEVAEKGKGAAALEARLRALGA